MRQTIGTRKSSGDKLENKSNSYKLNDRGLVTSFILN